MGLVCGVQDNGVEGGTTLGSLGWTLGSDEICTRTRFGLMTGIPEVGDTGLCTTLGSLVEACDAGVVDGCAGR